MKPTVTISLEEYNSLKDLEKNFYQQRNVVKFFRPNFYMNSTRYDEEIDFLMLNDCLDLASSVNKELISQINRLENDVKESNQKILMLNYDLSLEKSKSWFTKLIWR
jgi:hypothetical protein